MANQQNKAFFIDRDGVLIKEKNYLSDPAQIELFHVTADAIKLIRHAGYKAIIISNQSGVARGYFGEDDITIIEKNIDDILKADGAEIDAWYYCCHHPKGTVEQYAIDCDCRKPEPGMILQAAKDHQINLAESFMIGDKFSDLEAASNAGCKASVLVRTGHGEEEIQNNPDRTAVIKDNILEAVKQLLSSSGIPA